MSPSSNPSAAVIALRDLIAKWEQEREGYVRGMMRMSPVGDMNRASANAVQRFLADLDALVSRVELPPQAQVEQLVIALTDDIRTDLRVHYSTDLPAGWLDVLIRQHLRAFFAAPPSPPTQEPT